MQIKKREIIELEIKNVAFEGGGIGDFNGMKCFVEGTLVGDKVLAKVIKVKKNYLIASLEKIIKASPLRIPTICPHADVCRGCQLQFASYEDQLKLKKTYIIDCLERLGGFENVELEDMISSPEQFHYRNKMEFSFGYDSERKFALGFHMPNRRFDKIDISVCYLQSPFLNEILNFVRDFAIEHNFVPFSYSDGSGDFRSLFIREGKRTGEVMINIVSSDNISSEHSKKVEELGKLIYSLKPKSPEELSKKITSVYWTKIISKKGSPRITKSNLLFGKAFIQEKMIIDQDELIFNISPQSFFQVNTYQAENLYRIIRDYATINKQGVVFDLFCGAGTIGLFLSKYVEKVVGIEILEEAVISGRENAQNNGVFNMDLFVGDVFEKLKSIRERPSLVVLDPPRAGLTEKTIVKLNDFSPPQIIYVSCNPSTLARDLGLFSKFGYELKSVKGVDMFPQTYHIESVAFLEKKISSF